MRYRKNELSQYRINLELDRLNEMASQLIRHERYAISWDEAIDRQIAALQVEAPQVYAALIRAAIAASDSLDAA